MMPAAKCNAKKYKAYTHNTIVVKLSLYSTSQYAPLYNTSTVLDTNQSQKFAINPLE